MVLRYGFSPVSELVRPVDRGEGLLAKNIIERSGTRMVLAPTAGQYAAPLKGSREFRKTVKGGAKIDNRGGEKVYHIQGSWGFALRDLRGRLERRPATGFGGRFSPAAQADPANRRRKSAGD
jgi:hypothetical protein